MEESHRTNPPIRQPLEWPLSKHNKARRAVRATVKCYGLNSNWQSGWARRSRARKSRAGGLCVFNWQAFVYSREYSGGCVCVLTSEVSGGAFRACTHRLKVTLTAVTYYLCLSVSVSTAVVQVDGNPVRLQLCDTAGQVSCVHTYYITYLVSRSQCMHCMPLNHCFKLIPMKCCTDIHGPRLG